MSYKSNWNEYVTYATRRFSAISGMIGSGLHEGYIPDFSAISGALQYDHLDHIGVILLKPDAIIGGKVEAICEFLFRNDLRILTVQWIDKISEKQCEEIYRFALNLGNSRPMIGNWWLFRRSFDFAPKLLLTVGLTNKSEATVHHLLKEIKGDNSPANCKPGHLRYEFGAC